MTANRSSVINMWRNLLVTILDTQAFWPLPGDLQRPQKEFLNQPPVLRIVEPRASLSYTSRGFKVHLNTGVNQCPLPE